MIINKLHKTLLFVAIILMSISGVFAQSDVSSPYSRFGLGTMSNNRPNTIIQGMGGICNALDGKYLLNSSNPASYAELDSLTFLLDAGFYMKSATYRDAHSSEKGSNASFDYFDLGFGVTKWLKMGLGAAPFSSRAYTSTASFIWEQDYPYTIDYEGTGGLNKLYWASGIRICKSLSLGVKVNYIFGNITDVTTLYFPNYAHFHNERRSINLSFSDATFDFGMIYKQKLTGDYRLTFGATYSLPANMNAHRNVFIRTMFKGYGSLTETVQDTILYTSGEKTVVKYPQGLSAGITLQNGERWLIGIDFNWNNWSAFRMNNSNDSLQDSWKIAIGGCFTPRNSSVSSYFRKMTYRAGFHYDHPAYKPIRFAGEMELRVFGVVTAVIHRFTILPSQSEAE